MAAPIRVLVADDSAFMRKTIPKLLEHSPRIKVIATACDGKEVIERILKLKPDVITLDVEMPRLDGLATLRYIMRNYPTPVVMVSAYTQREAQITLQALESGAVDFVPKPSGTISLDIKEVRDELIAKVRTAAEVDLKKLGRVFRRRLPMPYLFRRPPIVEGKVVAIGASTGGLPALETVLSRFPGGFPAPILVVQHMPPTFTTSLAKSLNSLSRIEVREASKGEAIKSGTALIAPGGYHLTVRRQYREEEVIAWVDKEPKDTPHRPSVDVMMESVADVYGAGAIGVILTGMGDDGTKGLKAIKTKGGKTIAEDESSCVVFGMPKAAIESGAVDRVLHLSRMAQGIMGMI